VDKRDDDAVILDLADDAAPAAAALPTLNENGPADDLPPGAVRQDDGSVLYTLHHPCTIKFRRQSDGATREEALTELRLHRLTGADMRAITAVKPEQMTVVAIARSARINEAKMALFFDVMDASDATAAGEVVSSFLGTGRRTGR
jgi:hypothetical protein